MRVARIIGFRNLYFGLTPGMNTTILVQVLSRYMTILLNTWTPRRGSDFPKMLIAASATRFLMWLQFLLTEALCL